MRAGALREPELVTCALYCTACGTHQARELYAAESIVRARANLSCVHCGRLGCLRLRPPPSEPPSACELGPDNEGDEPLVARRAHFWSFWPAR